MAITPHIHDENRKAELERRKEVPADFNCSGETTKVRSAKEEPPKVKK